VIDAATKFKLKNIFFILRSVILFQWYFVSLSYYEGIKEKRRKVKLGNVLFSSILEVSQVLKNHKH